MQHESLQVIQKFSGVSEYNGQQTAGRVSNSTKCCFKRRVRRVLPATWFSDEASLGLISSSMRSTCLMAYRTSKLFHVERKRIQQSLPRLRRLSVFSYSRIRFIGRLLGPYATNGMITATSRNYLLTGTVYPLAFSVPTTASHDSFLSRMRFAASNADRLDE